ncbi:hypothetical protein GWK90_09240 [Candidatus Hamiltonella defensa]|uniref:Peptidase C58 YopT-type domain-containing protein n=2 Tax=Candidatus Williamhamiltonella defendens TaxID=138072 RepID=C4K5Q2_HAMD5|nr:hypothetical protein [Candidatus Hamiltonella defensa]ACQ67895.1 hypothetical protein HDEF_1238 [Candidatus Hamiltonella defensa 5AT (Acyrthosiphon pisum)]ASV33093.1 hypothetical protein CJJ18_02145 [Candidatus Hamiltonella defensa]ATW22538.1 hypothetical protein BJP44_05485 [Candidatus Hamiltonella defensa]AWK16047.1 hypothetical protein CCS40_02160 [Candidatus Hamiltonella defensa]MBK4362343.1 hypothetical protein [Candidatus Hamiltonella defensa]
MLEKNDLTKIDCNQVKNNETHDKFVSRSIDLITLNKHKGENIYILFSSSSSKYKSGHAAAIMIENQQNKVKIIFSDPSHKLFIFDYPEYFEKWFRFACSNHFWYKNCDLFRIESHIKLKK